MSDTKDDSPTVISADVLGPMPTRAGDFADQKPRKGDPVTYQDAVWGIVESVDGNLCWLRRPNGNTEPFIWRFPRDNQLNVLHDWPTKREFRYSDGYRDEGTGAIDEGTGVTP